MDLPNRLNASLSENHEGSGLHHWSPSHDKACTSFQYLSTVMDDLSVDLGHAVGHFDSVKGGMRQIYRLLLLALCRYDPLPVMVKKAVELSVLSSTAAKLPMQKPPPQGSDIETITALDIPYTLRHFKFDVSAGSFNVNSDGAAVATTAWKTFSISGSKARTGRGGSSDASSGGSIPGNRVADRLSSAVHRTVQEAATGRSSGSSCYDGVRSCKPARTCAAQYGSLDDAPVPAAASVNSSNSAPTASVVSSPAPSPSESPLDDFAAVSGVRVGTESLAATLMFSGLDGSNSNRATSQMSQYFQRQQSASASITGEGRLCPLHSERSGGPISVSSCAVCASQHFLQRHLQRLASERGGLARLETALGDCLRLQRQWNRSIHWVASSVKDNRLPELLRPLIRCICTDAVFCDTRTTLRDVSGGGGGGGGGGCCSGTSTSRGVTVNPQIIISTDGHCGTLQCGSRCGNGGGSSVGSSR